MPKLIRLFIVISILYLTIVFPSAVNAGTDPLSATVSATARVPTTTPTTGDVTAPTNPILIRPVDGTVTGDNRPEFVWRASTDPNGNSVTYTLFINGVATYLGISNIGNSSGNGYTASIEGDERRLIPTSSMTDGVYSWYVAANDLSGNTSLSTTWNLTIDTTAPNITITDIDIYHNLLLDNNTPELFTDLNFDIAGPKDVYFTIRSESWSTVTLQFFDENNQLVAQSSWPVNNSGVIYPYQHLAIGVYRVIVSSFDRGGNTTALPDFRLTVSQATISIGLPTLPGGSPNPFISIPYSPLSIPSFPATIARIGTRLSLPYLIVVLLAIGLLLLLIILWMRRYNFFLLDEEGKPIRTATIYHSIPTTKTKYSEVLMSKRDPISYTMTSDDLGRLYIPHLSRYSTFTIRTDNKTYVLSLSVKSKSYTIVLG